jgi:hypothetical protein
LRRPAGEIGQPPAPVIDAERDVEYRASESAKVNRPAILPSCQSTALKFSLPLRRFPLFPKPTHLKGGVLMRCLLKVSIPVETGNATIGDGTLPKTIESILNELKPEAAYFLISPKKMASKRGSFSLI